MIRLIQMRLCVRQLRGALCNSSKVNVGRGGRNLPRGRVEAPFVDCT